MGGLRRNRWRRIGRRSVKKICVDSGFLIAYYDPSDGAHVKAVECFKEYLEETKNTVILPWPIMFESLNTRFVSDKKRLESFQRHISYFRGNDRLAFINDDRYREHALDECFDETRRPNANYRKLSLVDRILRAILQDPKLRIDAFITNNPRDFHDVCTRAQKEMIQI